MAGKKNALGTLAVLGGLAAAAAVAYKRREELKQLLEDVNERLFPTEEEPAEAPAEPEVIIELRRTAEPAETAETGEETGAR